MRLLNLCFISMKEPIFRKVAGCEPATLKSFTIILKSFAKSVSYLALCFSKLETTFFKKYLLYSGYSMWLQCHKTCIRRKKISFWKYLKFIQHSFWTLEEATRRCFERKCVLRNFTRPSILFKKRLWHRCSPVNFVKFLRTPFLQNSSRWLLLKLLTFVFFIFVSIQSVHDISEDLFFLST